MASIHQKYPSQTMELKTCTFGHPPCRLLALQCLAFAAGTYVKAL